MKGVMRLHNKGRNLFVECSIEFFHPNVPSRHRTNTPDIELPEDWLDGCGLDGNFDFMAWFDNIQWMQDPLLSFT
jgi:hypothetical protein